MLLSSFLVFIYLIIFIYCCPLCQTYVCQYFKSNNTPTFSKGIFTPSLALTLTQKSINPEIYKKHFAVCHVEKKHFKAYLKRQVLFVLITMTKQNKAIS